jgi:gliding motility-associated-like protein
MTVTTYTKNSSTAADRDSLEIFWGDGTQQFVKRDNSRTRIEPNDIKVNYYTANHTYPGSSTYTISFQDPNRIGNILNVNYPNSIDIPFFLSTTFTLLDQQFQGFNSSAILLQPPVDIGCVNKLFIHNPNAFDPDGDSLAFELGVPLQAVNSPVPLYSLPDKIGDPNGNKITINPLTGELIWDSPKLTGEYNIAIKILEYRNGKLINVILRDMQILIRLCDNDPPKIESLDELCVVAGEEINIPIIITDPNPNQKVKITATGGPFTLSDAATLEGPKYFTSAPFTARIIWKTKCEHISKEFYKIVVRAADKFYSDSTGLATLKTIRIKVVAPEPKDLKAQSMDESIVLTWKKPYRCEDTKNDYFLGFSVWRRATSSQFVQDTCAPGLTGKDYVKIAFKTTDFVDSTYKYVDNKITQGVTYCYRIQAEFARKTAAGNPFNRVEGLASEEVCIIAMRDLPMLTKVSVSNTDINDGSMHIRWTKPLANQLDTILHKGPYRYDILRAGTDNNYTKIYTIQVPFFGSSIDTNFMDKMINTLNQPWSYALEFYTNGNFYGVSQQATSVFTRAIPSDRKLTLDWNWKTPWANKTFDIYKLDKNIGTYAKIGDTSQASYTDKNLVNNEEYCYYILAEGSYNIPNIEEPLINASQIICAKPSDDVPPCPPTITVTNVCDLLTNGSNVENLFNTIVWNSITTKCKDEASDIDFYKIYYAASNSSPFKLIDSIVESSTLKYYHTPDLGLLGCYAVTSIDDKGNESELSEMFCVDNCPFYELPNTFTPNNDGFNDVFIPTVNLFVTQIEFKVFNQWGNQVFKTTDPKILWDGTYNGEKLPDGTYHYVCKVWENRVSGIFERNKPLTGFIHLQRNQ